MTILNLARGKLVKLFLLGIEMAEAEPEADASDKGKNSH